MDQISEISTLTGRELLVKIAFNQERMADQLTDVVKSNGNLRQFVYGNGQPGLADQVRESQKWIGLINRLVWALVIPLVLSVIGFLVALLTNRVDLVVH